MVMHIVANARKNILKKRRNLVLPIEKERQSLEGGVGLRILENRLSYWTCFQENLCKSKFFEMD